MTEKKGDRRGLNPRQLEPQSTGLLKVTDTCATYAGGNDRNKPGGSGSNRAQSGNGLAPGVRVRITAGAAAGVVGVIFGPWPTYWTKGVPLWVVLRRDLVGRSIVREDYLEPIAGAA